MNKKILVVDDDEAILTCITGVLTDSGNTVEKANEGRGLEEKIKKISPNVVLLDISMPEFDGGEFLKLYRKRNGKDGIIFILISGNENIEEIARNSGADSFLAKPFEINELLDLLNYYFPSQNNL